MHRDTDFYTSLSMEKTFAKLLVASLEHIMDEALSDFTFVEIGSDTGTSVLSGITHPFPQVLTLRYGERISIPSKAIVFSNELIDALPFHRFVSHQDAWRERGIYLDAEGRFRECLLAEPTESARDLLSSLPIGEPVSEAYQLDLPNLNGSVLNEILQAPWEGLFITFDYGKSLAELLEHTPEGTARTYQKHRQGNDLLEDPGQQDITFHVCWDQVSSLLKQHGFHAIDLGRQGPFFMRHAATLLETIIHATAEKPDPETQRIKTLLMQMGHAFQVLCAKRVLPNR